MFFPTHIPTINVPSSDLNGDLTEGDDSTWAQEPIGDDDKYELRDKPIEQLSQEQRLNLFKKMGTDKSWLIKHREQALEVFLSIDLSQLKEVDQETLHAYKKFSKHGVFKFWGIDPKNFDEKDKFYVIFNNNTTKTKTKTKKINLRVWGLASKRLFQYLNNNDEENKNGIIRKKELKIKGNSLTEKAFNKINDFLFLKSAFDFKYEFDNDMLEEIKRLSKKFEIEFLTKTVEKILKISLAIGTEDDVDGSEFAMNRKDAVIKSPFDLAQYEPDTTHLTFVGDFASDAFTGEVSKATKLAFKSLNTSEIISLTFDNLNLKISVDSIVEMLKKTKKLQSFQAHHCNIAGSFKSSESINVLLKILRVLKDECKNLTELNLIDFTFIKIKKQKTEEIFDTVAKMQSLVEFHINLNLGSDTGLEQVFELPHLDTITLPKNLESSKKIPPIDLEVCYMPSSPTKWKKFLRPFDHKK